MTHEKTQGRVVEAADDSGMTWRMPAEWTPQSRIWMAFPSQGYTLGDTPEDAHRARQAWANVANACVEFEPVTMVIAPGDDEYARRYLDERIEIVEIPLDDAWMRDIGPTFVRAADGSLAAVNWVFNGWGGQTWARWENDQHVARAVAEKAGVPVVESPLVNEGGGFHVDGAGTALATESVQLDPGRNPALTAADVEAEFARVLGVEKVIWLKRGLWRDSAEYGTRGHVDIVATFAEPGTVLVHEQRNPQHPDYAICQEVVETLAHASDAAGRALNVVRVPAPDRLRDDEGWVDHSYINHLVLNGGVIACSFDDPADDVAKTLLEKAYPGRRVVQVDAREIFARGGGIHCITQQQPTS